MDIDDTTSLLDLASPIYFNQEQNGLPIIQIILLRCCAVSELRDCNVPSESQHDEEDGAQEIAMASSGGDKMDSNGSSLESCCFAKQLVPGALPKVMKVFSGICSKSSGNPYYGLVIGSRILGYRNRLDPVCLYIWIKIIRLPILFA